MNNDKIKSTLIQKIIYKISGRSEGYDLLLIKYSILILELCRPLIIFYRIIRVLFRRSNHDEVYHFSVVQFVLFSMQELISLNSEVYKDIVVGCNILII